MSAILESAEDALPAFEREVALSLIDLGIRADRLATRAYQVAKRCLDVVIATTLLLSLSWLLLLITLAIQLESEERTLTDGEVDAVLARAREELTRRFQAEFRG